MAKTVPIGKAAAKALEKHGEAMRLVAGKALYSAAIRGVQIIQTRLIPKAVPQPVDRSIYRAGWRALPLYDASGKINGGEIFNLEVTAAFIEKGVRASNVKVGRAMINALTEWVKRKGIVKLSKAQTKQGMDLEVEARKAAWAIALSLKKKGIFREGKGFRFLETLMVDLMPDIVLKEISAAARTPGG